MNALSQCPMANVLLLQLSKDKKRLVYLPVPGNRVRKPVASYLEENTHNHLSTIFFVYLHLEKPRGIELFGNTFIRIHWRTGRSMWLHFPALAVQFPNFLLCALGADSCSSGLASEGLSLNISFARVRAHLLNWTTRCVALTQGVISTASTVASESLLSRLTLYLQRSAASPDKPGRV